MEIVEPELIWTAEMCANAYFPRMTPGIRVNGSIINIERNNIQNKYLIDWVINKDSEPIAWLDTEYKPNMTKNLYPYFSVARYTYRYNKGEHNYPVETMKVRKFRQYPDRTFWMAIKADMKQAGIITGRIIIESPIRPRPKPEGFARDIEIFEFPNSSMIFCNAFDTDIEDYIIGQLAQVGEL